MKINILIVEDEELAAKRLQRLILEYWPDATILRVCDSKDAAINYLQNNPAPDLMFLDVQLGDGVCFDIFEVVPISNPVVFTTAYDEYALKAFELNSLDYLLKPINAEKLKRSLERYERMNRSTISADILALAPMLRNEEKSYKKRFLITIADKLVAIPSAEIAYICSTEKCTFIVDFKGTHYSIDLSIDKLEEMVDPAQFFRINRQYLISTASIVKMVLLSKSRIKLHLTPTPSTEILVSSTKTHDFRRWLDN